MIQSLHIRNIALIAELSLDFDSQLTVLTGETGAGKSILLGAISLVLGERTSTEIIRTGCESASVEALFAADPIPKLNDWLAEAGLPACEDGQLIIRRELSRNGRGKCLVNGGFTTVAVLQRLGEELIDLHGQHEHQSLLHRDRQRDLIDAWANLAGVRGEVTDVYRQLREAREAQQRLTLDESERQRRLDLLNFQVSEIDAAEVKPGESERLAEERNRLAHAEKLLTTVRSVLEILHWRETGTVRDELGACAEKLTALAAWESSFAADAESLKSAELLVSEVAERLANFSESFEADPARLEQVEDRLDVLRKLKSKYGATEEAILAFREQAAQDRSSLNRQDEELERLARQEQRLTVQLTEKALQLSKARQAASEQLAQAMEAELKPLGFNQPRFEVRVTPKEDPQGWVSRDGRHYACGPTGMDEIEFMIAANPGEDFKPVSRTASGGELSRIMLALKVIAAAAAEVPTMIFDEVDAGIGGATAEAVGRKLRVLAQDRQVIVITHLPQIARFAQHHFQVSKRVEQGRTLSLVSRLEGEARVEELARLLAGESSTPTALAHARELLEAK